MMQAHTHQLSADPDATSAAAAPLPAVVTASSVTSTSTSTSDYSIPTIDGMILTLIAQLHSHSSSEVPRLHCLQSNNRLNSSTSTHDGGGSGSLSSISYSSYSNSSVVTFSNPHSVLANLIEPHHDEILCSLLTQLNVALMRRIAAAQSATSSSSSSDSGTVTGTSTPSSQHDDDFLHKLGHGDDKSQTPHEFKSGLIYRLYHEYLFLPATTNVVVAADRYTVSSDSVSASASTISATSTTTTNNNTTLSSTALPLLSSPPKAQTSATRIAVLHLLDTLCSSSSSNLSLLRTYMVPLERQQEAVADLLVAPPWLRRSASAPYPHPVRDLGYAGLTQTGAFDNIIVWLQILFMIPEVRYSILTMKLKESNTKTKFLYELQSLFGRMSLSCQTIVDPRSFITALRTQSSARMREMFHDPEGMEAEEPSYVQQNVVEVFHEMMGIIEWEMTSLMNEEEKQKQQQQNHPPPHHHPPHPPNIITSLFTSTLTSHLTCLNPQCTSPIRQAGVEPSSMFALSIKGVSSSQKKDLHAALRNFFETNVVQEMTCPSCHVKGRGTHTQSLIHPLPPILLFHLRRYRLDYNTLQMDKVRERLEFPMELMMEEYCEDGKEGVESECKRATPLDSEHDLPHSHYPKEYYHYELTSVIVHLGVAGGGQYYNISKERGVDVGWNGRPSSSSTSTSTSSSSSSSFSTQLVHTINDSRPMLNVLRRDTLRVLLQFIETRSELTSLMTSSKRMSHEVHSIAHSSLPRHLIPVKWYHFCDMSTRRYDVAQLEKECFEGMHGAYMLCYTRIQNNLAYASSSSPFTSSSSSLSSSATPASSSSLIPSLPSDFLTQSLHTFVQPHVLAAIERENNDFLTRRVALDSNWSELTKFKKEYRKFAKRIIPAQGVD